MCDTLGKVTKSCGLFAKNSDRSPNEIQVMEYHPAARGLTGTLACTYITIPQAAETYGVLLSRPAWMWGAEMGVNEWGLCIGNEAVFTKGSYGKTGLTGMDLVRLGLERSKTAQEAVHLIIQLLETHGQGGNCGFDHDFYYDNAFLVMDPGEIFVLETAGKQWAVKQYEAASISNRLSLGADADAYAGGSIYDFRKRHLEPVYSTFSAAASRKQQTGGCLQGIQTVKDCMDALRQHHVRVKYPFGAGSVSSVCMHYGGLVGDHTTASMVVSLEDNRQVVWCTGSSLPCVSLFKPWLFGMEPVLPIVSVNDKSGEEYWLEAERFRRQLLGKKLPPEFYAQADAIQSDWISRASRVIDADFPEFSRACLAEEQAFFALWKNRHLESVPTASGFRNRWAKKNRVLFPEDTQ